MDDVYITGLIVDYHDLNQLSDIQKRLADYRPISPEDRRAIALFIGELVAAARKRPVFEDKHGTSP